MLYTQKSLFINIEIMIIDHLTKVHNLQKMEN